MRDVMQLLFAATAFAAGCGGGGEAEGEGEPPIFEPEPPGAPLEIADGRLSCLGDNMPPAPDATTLVLPGWARRLSDPRADQGAPAARVEAFDSDGTSLGITFADGVTGRVAITVPVHKDEEGFEGFVVTTLDGFVDYQLHSSRPYTENTYAGWVWLMTPDELADRAADAGVVLDSAKAVVIGAVHDCDVFGVANAVVRVDSSTDGILYSDGFDVSPDFTFTDDSGRFVAPNTSTGPVVVEAFGRLEEGGPLVLLSRADVTASAGAIVAVDLQPRMGVDR